MIINPKIGVDQLVFGMKQKDVVSLYGNPDKTFEDDDKNKILLYNDLKIRLTFYEDEDFKLGYIKSSNKNLVLFSEKIMNESWVKIASLLDKKGLKSLEKEENDSIENYFNESNWMTFQVEYNEVISFELGVTFTEKDECNWKFKS